MKFTLFLCWPISYVSWFNNLAVRLIIHVLSHAFQITSTIFWFKKNKNIPSLTRFNGESFVRVFMDSSLPFQAYWLIPCLLSHSLSYKQVCYWLMAWMLVMISIRFTSSTISSLCSTSIQIWSPSLFDYQQLLSSFSSLLAPIGLLMVLLVFGTNDTNLQK